MWRALMVIGLWALSTSYGYAQGADRSQAYGVLASVIDTALGISGAPSQYFLVGSNNQRGTAVPNPAFTYQAVVTIGSWTGEVTIHGAGLYSLASLAVQADVMEPAGRMERWFRNAQGGLNCTNRGTGATGVYGNIQDCEDPDYSGVVYSYQYGSEYLGHLGQYIARTRSNVMAGITTHPLSSDNPDCSFDGNVSRAYQLSGYHDDAASADAAASAHGFQRGLSATGRVARCRSWMESLSPDGEPFAALVNAAVAWLIANPVYAPDHFVSFEQPGPEFLPWEGGGGSPGGGDGGCIEVDGQIICGGGQAPYEDYYPEDAQTNCAVIDIPCNLRRLFLPTEPWGERWGGLPGEFPTRIPFGLASWSPAAFIGTHSYGDAETWQVHTCPTINIHWTVPGQSGLPLDTANVDYNWCDNAIVDKWVEFGRPLLMWVFFAMVVFAGYRRLTSA